MFKKVAIIGAGFMGGSLALALKEKFPLIKLYAFARSKKSLLKLKKAAIFDQVSTDLEEIVRGKDLIVLSTPVSAIIDLLSKMAPVLVKKTLLIDMGSTKSGICVKAEEILPYPSNFTGCHPLCGSEKQGIQYSRPDLYRGALCICVGRGKSSVQLRIAKLWQTLGSDPVWMTAERHDRILAAVSHLPHLLSFALSGVTDKKDAGYAATGFRDMTRLACSSPELWADIFLSNRGNLLSSLKKMIRTLEDYCSVLKSNDRKKLKSMLEQSKRKMNSVVMNKL